MIRNEEIFLATTLLKSGKVVAFPTETVYGLGADARNETAVKQIFAIKQRPLTNPLIVHLADQQQVANWACDVPDHAYALMSAFWPGPLTLLLKKAPNVSPLITAGQDLIGLRVPKHPVAAALLKAFGDGLAAPSANRYTRVSPTTAEAVYEALGTDVAMILDGGPCEVGLESTILDMSAAVPVLLRPGMIPLEALEAVIQQKITTHNAQKVLAPGMHHLHYAPKTPVKLVADVVSIAENKRIALLAYEPVTNLPVNIEFIAMPNEPYAYAQQLYEVLRKVDNKDFELILIQTVPTSNAWHAINDRLLKASAVRST